jgi:hypothetical protein
MAMKTNTFKALVGLLSLSAFGTAARATPPTSPGHTLTIRTPVRLPQGHDWFAVSEGRFLTSGQGVDSSRTAPHAKLAMGAKACVVMLNAPTTYLDAGTSAHGNEIEVKSGSFLGIRIDTSYVALNGGGLKYLVCYRKDGRVATSNISYLNMKQTLAGTIGYIDLQ